MNGNQILLVLKQQGFEKGTLAVLMRLAEEIEDHNKALKEFANAFEQLVTVQGMMNGALDGMKDGLSKLQRQDDDPQSTREMVG